MRVPLSILDLAVVSRDQSIGDALAGCVALAQAAERFGYERVWYAEHHNMGSIASSATSVLIAHVAAHTERIRLGSGGVMLPNHSPLVIAEQFGTLASLHPGRIDLGLGRAPGTDQTTLRALRRDPTAADAFPQDVQELMGYLGDQTLVPTVEAVPGKGTHVPVYILGSSLFGASVAAALGLPFGFASHFAPDALQAAVALYRERFRPSAQLAEPHVIAGANVIATDDADEAEAELLAVRRRRVARFVARGQRLSDEQADELLGSPAGRQLQAMMTYTIAGTPDVVVDWLDSFATHADADELIVVHAGLTIESRLRSLELVAKAAA